MNHNRKARQLAVTVREEFLMMTFIGVEVNCVGTDSAGHILAPRVQFTSSCSALWTVDGAACKWVGFVKF
jgi:hypothetical protein